MVTFSCPRSWSQFAQDHSVCPKCNLDIHVFFGLLDYVQRPLVALRHPERNGCQGRLDFVKASPAQGSQCTG